MLSWWADRAELWVDGDRVHTGDLFDTRCRWELPARWWHGEELTLVVRLRSPLHDEGALLHSRIELEPLDPSDPHGLLDPTLRDLRQLRHERGLAAGPGPGVVGVLGHAHLDLAWLWPVADTWRAAERTFGSALDLIDRFSDLHFGHSTPALYAWLERQRPALFTRIRRAMQAGRWEPLNGPWVETDCVLISTASLLRQFQEGQRYSRQAFPEWPHTVAWLPDSFGFGAGLPAVAAATGVRWFCTHKLAWNATNPFPHRLFRWRSRCGREVLALITAPIGTDGDPLAIERYRLEWQRASGCLDALWLPGVGDHGGGPTAETLEQLALWQQQPDAVQQRHGSLRSYLERLEPLRSGLPVWRDELYLELHRGCATSRPDQKRHNRSLERLLREAELVQALVGLAADGPDWRPLLFQQFHDILPGTSIPEVFQQAEPQWRAARRDARRQRDQALLNGLAWASPPPVTAETAAAENRSARFERVEPEQLWWAVQLQPLPAAPRTLRLPAGSWRLAAPGTERQLSGQPAPGGGQWLQLPGIEGIDALALRRDPDPRAVRGPSKAGPLPISHPVRLDPAPDLGPGRWRLGNGLITAAIGPAGVEQIWDSAGIPQLAGCLQWCRWRDQGEYWDAWDIAADYRDHPLGWHWWGEPEWIERGALCSRFLWRGHCGASPVRLDGRLLAGTPWLELTLSLQWRQRHELLRLEIPLATPAARWAADTSGGVIERPAVARTARERERWEVPVISWLASVATGGRGSGLAVLLDGPQGVSATAERLGVSLLRAPTWPDPGADNGWQRQRLALAPAPGGWRQGGVPRHALRLREPIWLQPAPTSLQSTGRSLWRPFPALPADLRLVGLRAWADGEWGAEGGGDVVVAIQNEGPCRRLLELGPLWQPQARLNGLDDRTERSADGEQGRWLRPWELGFWRLSGRGCVDQSS